MTTQEQVAREKEEEIDKGLNLYKAERWADDMALCGMCIPGPY